MYQQDKTNSNLFSMDMSAEGIWLCCRTNIAHSADRADQAICTSGQMIQSNPMSVCHKVPPLELEHTL